VSVTASQQSLMDGAVRYLITKYNPKGNKVGWLMMSSVLVEAWDLYSIAFVLVFIREQYHPGALLLGLAAAGTQGGAMVGALLGGWLSDKIGRRVMFLSTMVLFIVLALAQAFVTSVLWLVVVRFALGVPLGSDISNGYTYIMESMRKGDREVMGNRWQFMFAVGEVATLAVIAVFLVLNIDHELVWRITLGLGAVPALVILVMRHDLPETAVWLVRHGRFREAKAVTATMYSDNLEMLPDADIVVPKPRPAAFLADISKDPIRWRATLYGWIACFAQGSEFSTFAFYIPVLFLMVGVSSLLGTDLVTMLLYIVAAISGWVGPMITPRIGHRGIGIAGFGIVLVSLLVAAWALYTGHTCRDAVGPLLGRVELHDHPDHGGPPGISRHRERLCLHVRQTAVVPGDLPVPIAVRGRRAGHRHPDGCDLPTGGPARGDLHPARGLWVRSRLTAYQNAHPRRLHRRVHGGTARVG
jgi:MFS family permease